MAEFTTAQQRDIDDFSSETYRNSFLESLDNERSRTVLDDPKKWEKGGYGNLEETRKQADELRSKVADTMKQIAEKNAQLRNCTDAEQRATLIAEIKELIEMLKKMLEELAQIFQKTAGDKKSSFLFGKGAFENWAQSIKDDMDTQLGGIIQMSDQLDAMTDAQVETKEALDKMSEQMAEEQKEMMKKMDELIASVKGKEADVKEHAETGEKISSALEQRADADKQEAQTKQVYLEAARKNLELVKNSLYGSNGLMMKEGLKEATALRSGEMYYIINPEALSSKNARYNNMIFGERDVEREAGVRTFRQTPLFVALDATGKTADMTIIYTEQELAKYMSESKDPKLNEIFKNTPALQKTLDADKKFETNRDSLIERLEQTKKEFIEKCGEGGEKELPKKDFDLFVAKFDTLIHGGEVSRVFSEQELGGMKIGDFSGLKGITSSDVTVQSSKMRDGTVHIITQDSQRLNDVELVMNRLAGEVYKATGMEMPNMDWKQLDKELKEYGNLFKEDLKTIDFGADNKVIADTVRQIGEAVVANGKQEMTLDSMIGEIVQTRDDIISTTEKELKQLASSKELNEQNVVEVHTQYQTLKEKVAELRNDFVERQNTDNPMSIEDFDKRRNELIYGQVSLEITMRKTWPDPHFMSQKVADMQRQFDNQYGMGKLDVKMGQDGNIIIADNESQKSRTIFYDGKNVCAVFADDMTVDKDEKGSCPYGVPVYTIHDGEIAYVNNHFALEVTQTLQMAEQISIREDIKREMEAQMANTEQEQALTNVASKIVELAEGRLAHEEYKVVAMAGQYVIQDANGNFADKQRFSSLEEAQARIAELENKTANFGKPAGDQKEQEQPEKDDPNKDEQNKDENDERV